MAVNTETLQQKHPLKDLSVRTLKLVSELSSVTKYNRGEIIFEIGDTDDLTAYLISGKIALKSTDNRVIHIDHSNTSAQFGLSSLKPRLYMAEAMQDETTVIWIKTELLDNLSNGKIATNIQCEFID